jgi:hypothetical protein
MVREYTNRDGEKKSAFTKIGAAFQTKNGGYQVVLDAFPAPVDGQYKILLMEPRQDTGRQQQASGFDDTPF